jgi:hypothetical protein
MMPQTSRMRRRVMFCNAARQPSYLSFQLYSYAAAAQLSSPETSCHHAGSRRREMMCTKLSGFASLAAWSPGHLHANLMSMSVASTIKGVGTQLCWTNSSSSSISSGYYSSMVAYLTSYPDKSPSIIHVHRVDFRGPPGWGDKIQFYCIFNVQFPNKKLGDFEVRGGVRCSPPYAHMYMSRLLLS